MTHIQQLQAYGFLLSFTTMKRRTSDVHKGRKSLRRLGSRLEDSDDAVRVKALEALRELESVELAQHADAVVARLEDSEWAVRRSALETLGQLEPAALAQHADTVVARLEDSDSIVRAVALKTLGYLEPLALAQHADAVAARLEDSNWVGREMALKTLGTLEPGTLAQHADAVIARLEDSDEQVRRTSLQMLGKLEPATLAQHAHAVVRRLEDSDGLVRRAAKLALRSLPRFVTRPGDYFDDRSVRSRYLGRLGWYKCRLRLREKCLVLYWYARIYRAMRETLRHGARWTRRAAASPPPRGHARGGERRSQTRTSRNCWPPLPCGHRAVEE